MNSSNTKRKNRTNNANRPPRNKTYTVEKAAVSCNEMIDGVYGNARFMHAATSLVGCLVTVATANGTTYEGVFRTFSQQCDLVLELAHNTDKTQLPTKDAIIDKLIIKMPDVVCLTVPNADLEYATKEQFSTDTAISKYNGQIVERELEPWDEATGEVEDIPALDVDNENGWDVNDMFRTNEQQYGVQSSYDNTLSGYTTPLERKNTDEYKKQEAKASKIALEIENSPTYLARNNTENGDNEEDKFSAVVRPDMGNSTQFHRYLPPAKRKNAQSGKLPRMSTNQQQNNHNMSPNMKSHAPPSGHGSQQHMPHGSNYGPRMQQQPLLQQHGQPPGAHTPPTHYGPPQQPSSMGGVPTVPHHHQPPPQQPHQPPMAPQQQQQQQQQLPPAMKLSPILPENDVKVNGEKSDKEEKKNNVRSENLIVDFRENDGKKLPVASEPQQLQQQSHISSKIDRKNLAPKARDEQIAELKKFSSDFKLGENEEDCSKTELSDAKEKNETDSDKVASLLKKSTLNPNAKEFVLNPNAKAFTPRSPSTQTPTPPRPHTPSTSVITQPLSIMQTQPVFTGLQPQYMMPAPVTVSLNSPFNPAAPMQQAPRMRKTMPPSMHQQRHEFSQVAAATGQPLLAPPSIPGHPHHITVQYTHQGLMPNHGQPGLSYPQVYSVLGPRMVTPQHISMVSTTHGASYGDNQHQIFVSAHPSAQLAAAMPGPNHHQHQHQHQHAASQMQTLSAGPPHSTPPNQQGPPMPGQGQGGGVHPTPSPVHQPPPQHGGPPPPQPTPPASVGTPQSLVYQQPHPAQMGQPPPLQPSPHTPQSPQTMHPGAGGPLGHNHHMQQHHNTVTHASNASHGGPHMSQGAHPQHPGAASGGPAGYPSQGPQPLVLIHQQGHGHPQAGHTFQGPMHGPGPTVIMPHSSMPVSVMPATSGAATMSTHPQLYIPHHAASQAQLQPYAHAQ